MSKRFRNEQVLRSSYRSLKRIGQALRGRDIWQGVQIRLQGLCLGNEGAEWSVYPANLSEHSVVYSFGVGEDISFDLKLIEKFGLTVHAFDPTPRSIEWIGTQNVPPNFYFHAFGVAHYDGTGKFSPPVDQNYISHTILERDTPWPAVNVPLQRLMTIMKTLGHEKIDLLKMDIEGAEYAVLADLLASRIRVDQLLVEFHHRWPEVGINKTKKAIKDLNAAGYQVFSVSSTGEEYSFLCTSIS